MFSRWRFPRNMTIFPAPSRNWNRMLELGGNIYFTAKLAATDGLSFQQIAAIMTGATQEAYAQMMLKGGRPVDGNRSKKEWANRG